ncbi:30S ribosomal protein S16 [Aequorivita antarctica]|uniref:Small ribosomal subunit protein bS16 n=1 Tax=Aequorivita antarctica TaxID=153266 RepID=A0A5C6Z2L2_9FLAO|nr:30S ribosomal protein S16 [Aequorivita antarctica]TXD73935.1 30S ribosomal protein S16 [Aequorivita antarctica]SRX73345.1 30S ribosomal protein S16 [Aequorivita antarctica]
MPVKIRLQRHGKKGKPYFWIIAADSRSKRDGKFLAKLGFYNPTTNPAQIDLDVDSTVQWLQNGAQPTDTARAILSYKGALMKNHLAGGVRKGALTEEQAEAKYNEWVESKKGSIDHKKATLSEAQQKLRAEALVAEKAVSDKRAADAAAAAAPAEEEVTEEVEATAETPTEEAPATEVKEEEAPAAKSAIEEAADEAKEDKKEA